MRLTTALFLATLSASGVINRSVDAFQPTVRASQAWIQAPAAGRTETSAFVAIDNGTMYDVYIVGAHADVATIEMREHPKGAATPVAVKEVPVPAFGRLEMSPEGLHLHLSALTKPLVAGEVVDLVIYTDGGEQLTVAATVK